MNTVNVSSKALGVIVSNLLKILKVEMNEFRNQVKQSALQHNAAIESSWSSRIFKSKKSVDVESYSMDDEEFFKNLDFTHKISTLNSLLNMCKLSNGSITIDSKTCNLLMNEIDRLNLKYSEDTIKETDNVIQECNWL